MSNVHGITIICSWLVMIMAKGMENHSCEQEQPKQPIVVALESENIKEEVSDKTYTRIIEHCITSLHAQGDYPRLISTYYQQHSKFRWHIAKMMQDNNYLQKCIEVAKEIEHNEALNALRSFKTMNKE